jgi:hypothetical protein
LKCSDLANVEIPKIEVANAANHAASVKTKDLVDETVYIINRVATPHAAVDPMSVLDLELILHR